MKEEHNLAINTSIRLAFIGSGNMANCIIGGLIKNGYPRDKITASDPNPNALNVLKEQFDINTSTDNVESCQWAQIVILAVKPQIMKPVARGIAPALTHKPLVISIAAGINSQQLQQWLGSDVPVIRVMPNTPALVQMGATGIYATTAVSRQQYDQAKAIFNTIGCTAHIEEESLIDAVTAVSGSGPAYFFLLMEAMVEAGVKQGLTRSTAESLTIQTALGAAELAKTSENSVAQLRRQVTSPGGTTEQAILYFQKSNFEQTVSGAMDACVERSRQLAEDFD